MAAKERSDIYQKLAPSTEPKPIQEENLPFLQRKLSIAFTGKPIQSLASVRSGETDSITKIPAPVNGVSFYFENGVSSIGVGEHKILMAGISAFTEKNGMNDKAPSLRVSFSLADYARACGVNIEADPKPTEAEQEKENIRAEYARKNFIKKIKTNCNTLMHTSMNWEERIKGKDTAYSGMVFISGYRVDSKNVTLDFSLKAAEYMVQLQLTVRPTTLYRIDDRKYNAYAIGNYLSSHYAIEQNAVKGTENLLRIENILKMTDLPSIDSLIEKGRKCEWKDRIKERFEESLDELVRVGLLSTWYYSHSKGIMLTDEEAQNIDSYDEWKDLLLCYEVENFKTRDERRAEHNEKKQQAKEKAKSRASTKRKKKKTK